MKRLTFCDLVEAETEFSRSELVEVAAVCSLLFRKHPALTGADPGARALGSACECDFRLLAEGAEAHVADEEWDLQAKRFLRSRPNDELGADGLLIEKRRSSQLRRQELKVIPPGERRESTPIAETGP